MKYASIDVETGGLEAGQHDLLEVGVVVEDMQRLVPLDQLPTLRLLVKPLKELGYYRLEPFAAGMNAKLLETIKGFPASVSGVVRKGDPAVIQGDGTRVLHVEANQVGLSIATFLIENEAAWPNKEGFLGAVAAGKNFANFDWGFLKACPGFQDAIRFKHRVLDPMMLYLRPDDMEPPDLKECCKRAGIDLTDWKLHTAVDDAKLVIELIRRGLRLNVQDRQETGPRAEGRRAFQLGKISSDNPYHEVSKDYWEWYEGFREAGIP